MTRRVEYSPEAARELVDLYAFIADASSGDVAQRYTTAIADLCESLGDFPHRGHTRDDLHHGLRIIGFRRRVTIAFTVSDATVQIIRVLYGGRDYETLLADGRD